MSEEQKPLEYFVEVSIKIKTPTERWETDVFKQRFSLEYFNNVDPLMIQRVVATINKLEVPHV
jgi:hypothetical protein